MRVLSRLGRFDALKRLLEAGADATHLRWTPLIEAVALGIPTDVEARLRDGDSLEDRDYWERTAWLVAIQTGDIAKAGLLRGHGANTRAFGRCGKPPLFYAIENHHVAILRWLLAAGLDTEQTDEFGTTSLITAVEVDDLDCVDVLLAAGVEIDRVHNGGTALASVQSRPVALRLLAVGADPAGRTVQIAGEHEDHYDPDFCIYNDVFVHELDGTIRMLGYPESVFPPTDFHSATLVDHFIYVIGVARLWTGTDPRNADLPAQYPHVRDRAAARHGRITGVDSSPPRHAHDGTGDSHSRRHDCEGSRRPASAHREQPRIHSRTRPDALARHGAGESVVNLSLHPKSQNLL